MSHSLLIVTILYKKGLVMFIGLQGGVHSPLQCVAFCCSHMVVTLDHKRPFVRRSIGRGHHREKVYCTVLQCVAVRRSMLQYDAVCCSVLQCVAVPKEGVYPHECVAVCCSMLYFVVVCCSVLQCVAVCCSVL